MNYRIFCIIISIWSLIDAYKRKNNIIIWPILNLILAPIILPIYLAKRNLKKTEVREGGTAWNILRNFALTWTVTILVYTINVFINLANVGSTAVDQPVSTSAGMGALFSLASLPTLPFIWLIPMLGAIVLGYFLRKSTYIEKGPTGKLAK